MMNTQGKAMKKPRPWYLVPGLLVFALSIPGFIILDTSSSVYTRIQREQEASHLAGSLQSLLTEPVSGPDQDNPGMPMRGPGMTGQGTESREAPNLRWQILEDSPRLTAFVQTAREIVANETDSGLESLGIWLPRSGLVWKTGANTLALESALALDPEWERLPYGDLVFHTPRENVMVYLRPLMRAPARRMAPPGPELRGLFLVQSYRGGDLVIQGLGRRILVWTMAGLVWVALITMMLLLRRNQKLQEDLGRTEVLARAGTAARTLAHEVRTPLSIILMQNSLLRKTIDPVHLPALDRMQGEARRIQNLSDQLGRLLRQDNPAPSPSQTGNPVVPPGSTRLVPWLENLHSGDTWSGLEILAGPRLEVLMPEDELFTIFSNILNNAREADPHTPLHICWHLVPDQTARNGQGDQVKILLRDLAGGLSWTRQRRIFDPFYTTKDSGMGLGLKISRDLARQRGGELTCRSRQGFNKEGLRKKGTEFILILPALADDPTEDTDVT